MDWKLIEYRMCSVQRVQTSVRIRTFFSDHNSRLLTLHLVPGIMPKTPELILYRVHERRFGDLTD